MPISIARVDENHEVLERLADTSDWLLRTIGKSEARKLCLLQYVDPYGDTVFNRMQLEDLNRDLNVLLSQLLSEEARRVIVGVQEMSDRCRDEVHTYLKFIGD
jgi:hypothetical protein